MVIYWYPQSLTQAARGTALIFRTLTNDNYSVTKEHFYSMSHTVWQRIGPKGIILILVNRYLIVDIYSLKIDSVSFIFRPIFVSAP